MRMEINIISLNNKTMYEIMTYDGEVFYIPEEEIEEFKELHLDNIKSIQKED